MNKELTPLEALENLYHNIGSSTENYLIVESAIKRLERLEKSFKQATDMKCDMERIINRDSKKLKALEIIKEKNVNLALIKISKSVEEYNKWALVNNILVDIDQRALTQEEYDLLKEVLK